MKLSSAVSWGLETDLVELAAAFEAGHPPLDHQQAEALRTLVRIGTRDHDHQVGVDAVGDERLGAVEDPVVPVPHRTGLDALQIAAGSRFGHRDRGDDLPAAEPRQPALLLLLGGQVGQIGLNHIVLQGEAQAAVVTAGVLLTDDRVVAEVADPAAAVLLRYRHPEEALLAGLDPDVAVDDALLLPTIVVRSGVQLEELPVVLTVEGVFGVEQGAFHDSPRAGDLDGSSAPARHAARPDQQQIMTRGPPPTGPERAPFMTEAIPAAGHRNRGT